MATLNKTQREEIVDALMREATNKWDESVNGKRAEELRIEMEDAVAVKQIEAHPHVERKVLFKYGMAWECYRRTSVKRDESGLRIARYFEKKDGNDYSVAMIEMKTLDFTTTSKVTTMNTEEDRLEFLLKTCPEQLDEWYMVVTTKQCELGKLRDAYHEVLNQCRTHRQFLKVFPTRADLLPKSAPAKSDVVPTAALRTINAMVGE